MGLNLGGITDATKGIEDKMSGLNDALNPYDAAKKMAGTIPFWSTGARSFIKIGGKPVGICTDFRWQISYQATPIHTIDTPHAWDIDIGQVSINANLSNILDPTEGPEALGLFHIMSAAVHQPMVEMQVLDALGTSIFFARGMFTTVNGNISRGQLSGMSAGFVGVAYQHYVSQQFKPYNSIAGKLTGAIGGLKSLASTASGGLL